MNVERELEIGKWLRDNEIDLDIKANQYLDLVKVIDKFHTDELKKQGITKKYTKEYLLSLLGDSLDLDDAIKELKRLD